MADSGICKDTELDFFLVETTSIGDRDALLAMGMDAYVLFRGDGTVEMLMAGMTLPGTWADGVLTFSMGDESMTMGYTLDGDALTVIQGEGGEGDGRDVYRRSDYDSYDSGAAAPAGAGETVEVPVTDGFRDGLMSAVCPEGWYGRKTPFMDGMLTFNTNPEPFGVKNVYLKYDIKECVTIEGEGERLEDQTNPDTGWVWEMACAEDGQLVAVAYVGASAIKLTTDGLEEEDVGVLRAIISSAGLTWETEESGLSVCEGGETDFFELRSMTTPSSTGNRSLLTTMGFDWCILFRGDGTVTAKLDGAVTCHWGDGFGAVVNGTWTNGAMTFTCGDKAGTVEYALEGDRMAFTLLDAAMESTPLVFQRSNAEPPDFDALAQ